MYVDSSYRSFLLWGTTIMSRIVPQYDLSGKLVVGETEISQVDPIPVQELSFDERPQPTGSILSVSRIISPPIERSAYDLVHPPQS